MYCIRAKYLHLIEIWAEVKSEIDLQLRLAFVLEMVLDSHVWRTSFGDNVVEPLLDYVGIWYPPELPSQ